MQSEPKREDCPVTGPGLQPRQLEAHPLRHPRSHEWISESGNQLTTVATSKPSPLSSPSCSPPLPDLTFAEEAVPGKAGAAGTAVGARGIEAVGVRAAPVLLEGAFIQVCRRQGPEPPRCVH